MKLDLFMRCSRGVTSSMTNHTRFLKVLGAFSSSVMSQHQAKPCRIETMSNGPSKPIFDVEIPLSKILDEEMKEDCRSCKVIGMPFPALDVELKLIIFTQEPWHPSVSQHISSSLVGPNFASGKKPS